MYNNKQISKRLEKLSAILKSSVRDRELMEEQLADLHFSVTRSKAPKLYDEHLVGFELVDSDDDQEQAVGVGVFKVGDEMLLSPLFFVSGRHMGEELMYIAERGLMVPFTERWVNYILEKDPIVLGEGEDTEGMDIDEPDFGFLGGPEEGEHDGRRQSGISLPKLSNITENSTKQALINFLKEADQSAKEGFYDFMLSSPKIAEYFTNSTPNFMDLLQPNKEQPILNLNFDDENSVEVYKKAQRWMDDSDKELIIREGYLVKDARTEMNEIEQSSSFKTISGYGPTLVIDKESGDKVEVVVLKEVDSPNMDGLTDPGLMFNPKSKDLYRLYRMDANDGSGGMVAEVGNAYTEPYQELLDGVGEGSVSANNDYVFINPYHPQCIRVDVKNVITNRDDGFKKLESYDFNDYYIVLNSKDRDVRDISIEEKEDGHQTVFIPDSWKIVKLSDKVLDEATDKFKTYDQAVSERTKLAAVKGLDTHVIEFNNERYVAKNRADVISTLVKKCNLSSGDAEKVWNDFDNIGRKVYFIKEAQPAGMPPMDMPMDMPMEPPEELAPETERMREIAEKALDEGQDQVVDLAGLSRLLATTDSDRLVTSYLGDVITGLDKQGKILFMIYSDYENYEENLGRDDLEELLEGMRDAFESLGDAILDQKESLDRPDAGII